MHPDFHNDTLKAIAQASGTQYAEAKLSFPIVYWSANNEQFNAGYMNGTYYTNDCFPCVMIYPFIMSDGTSDHIVLSVFENRGVKKQEELMIKETPVEVVETIKKISAEIGKTAVQVNEAAGFVVNRILIPMINEAAFIKMEGVSDVAGIDAAMKLGANHPMGPLELGDFIGLDICLAIMDVLYNETGDSKYRANVLIRKMVRAGKLGIKSGEGFFNYKK